MNLDPRYLSVTEWTDGMALQLLSYSNPPRLDDPAHWRSWALVVIQSPRVAATNPPDPASYEDWREWAMRFNQMVVLTT